jgi:hypothetical protein
MWDLWWTKWRWGRFFPTISVSPVNLHSTACSTITIIYHLGLVQQATSGRSTKWTQSHPTENNNNYKKHYFIDLYRFRNLFPEFPQSLVFAKKKN